MSQSFSPWKYNPEPKIRFDSFTGEKRENVEHWIVDQDGQTIAILCEYKVSVKSNGALLSSAPEMLNILERLVNPKDENYDQIHADALSIIKKAKGEL